jgi:hypothetical protein
MDKNTNNKPKMKARDDDKIKNENKNSDKNRTAGRGCIIGKRATETTRHGQSKDRNIQRDEDRHMDRVRQILTQTFSLRRIVAGPAHRASNAPLGDHVYLRLETGTKAQSNRHIKKLPYILNGRHEERAQEQQAT